jgi:hypothetical protein
MGGHRAACGGRGGLGGGAGAAELVLGFGICAEAQDLVAGLLQVCERNSKVSKTFFDFLQVRWVTTV